MSRRIFRQLAQTGGLVDWLADHGVLEALVGAYVAGDRLAGRDADPGVAFWCLVADSPGDRAAGGQCLAFGIVEVIGGTEDGQGRVTFELVDESVVAIDFVDDDREEPVQKVDNLGGGPTGHQLRGPDDVDEDHRDVALLAAQLRPLLLRRGGYLTADVTTEQIPNTLSLT